MKLFLVNASQHDLFVFADSEADAIEVARKDENKFDETVTYTYGGITVEDEFSIAPGIVYRIPSGEGSR
jgi:hypothetical protein